MGKKAHILVASAGYGPGQIAPAIGVQPLINGLADISQCNAWFGPRPYLETLAPQPAEDAKKQAYPAYLQLIPYVVFRHEGLYLRYKRTTTGGDDRLHGKLSIGIGGHVDLNDAVATNHGSVDIAETLNQAFRREAQEEIGLTLAADSLIWAATLYATDTAVDTVHLGVIAIYELSADEFARIRGNDEIADIRFATFAEINTEAQADETISIETWTRMIIDSRAFA